MYFFSHNNNRPVLFAVLSRCSSFETSTSYQQKCQLKFWWFWLNLSLCSYSLAQWCTLPAIRTLMANFGDIHGHFWSIIMPLAKNIESIVPTEGLFSPDNILTFFICGHEYVRIDFFLLLPDSFCVSPLLPIATLLFTPGLLGWLKDKAVEHCQPGKL